ncbi:hypothetical protein N0V82_000368 [Gnomoniopsis sp. IMI 355080]|nr:hypothetical protein N0V82_000368 [Gnomoniopsis sp. IMI 355080]
MTRFEYRCSVRNDHSSVNGGGSIAVDRVLPDSMVPHGVNISFKRTIRVPDNNGTSELPPDLGSFPLYRVSDYTARLPDEIVRKGGVFFPMHQKEAMWVSFRSTAPFMIKMYAGGVNVVSGEHSEEDAGTQARRISLLRQGRTIQDYVVVPPQPWIDGIAVKSGMVRQFVAMPLGQGYTVEAQLTGRRSREASSWRLPPQIVLGDFYILATTLTGKTVTIPANLTDTINHLKLRIQGKGGIPSHAQRLFLDGEFLIGPLTVADYKIPKGATLEIRQEQVGGGALLQTGHELGIAPGGLIKQDIREDPHVSGNWNRDLTFTIPIQIVSPQIFEDVTGTLAPPCPDNAQLYADAGLPFFSLFEEVPSNVSGAKAFVPVKSINEMETAQGLVAGQEPTVVPRTVKLFERSLGTKIWSDGDVYHVDDPDGLLNPDGPRREVRTRTDLEKELAQLGRTRF